ncbi:60S ribosomal protein L4-A-like protein [Leptotrombidium deliense]|uniref:60S ribosomal protein L4-A-like protein n=1 Tax=Leptotrombidium deliense TaxID=299467 RepID=A0A443SJC4_9ACAR|nr:60S ribosomal protein L4-A-like protein [Leptotrombidium deliense]
MATAAYRPLVSVYNENNESSGANVKLPAVFRAPIRTDVVNFVHTNMRKNKRHPYAVSMKAGHQTSAESWGTGRAVARIPRVRGGGTHRSGQGAFGNMCRGGRRFAPTRVWRRWQRHVNRNQKRYALVSAIAASGVPALVMSKGHAIEEVPEFPLVVSDKIQEYQKTKEAVKFLRKIRAWKDIEKVYNSKRFRAGKGKMRNRRRIQKLGPVVIYSKDSGLTRAFRNIPGVETINVEKLNLLRLAPGGHVGRFCIWTESAFRKLDELYGTWKSESRKKRGYNLPQPKMANSDLSRLLKSDEIQKSIRPRMYVILTKVVRKQIKRNPLKNPLVMKRLNPYASALRKSMRHLCERRRAARELLRKRRSGEKVDATELKKAADVLGVKLIKYKEYKKQILAKKAKWNSILEKVKQAKEKRAKTAEKTQKK